MSKKISLSQSKAVKAEVIVHCLDFIDNNDHEAKEQAIKKLTSYAKFYNLSPRRKASTPNLKKHLREFILNHKGYMVTIHALYNSLLN